MNRRLFLGLVGGTIAAAATPLEFQALADALAPAVLAPSMRFLSSLRFSVRASGLYTVRLGAPPYPGVIQTYLADGGSLCYQNAISIALPPNEAGLLIEGPCVDSWQMIWTEVVDNGTPLGQPLIYLQAKAREPVLLNLAWTEL